MKFFVIACLIAVAVAEPAAEAEADPYVLYGNNYAYGARTYAASPYYAGAYSGYSGYSRYAAPAYAGAYRSAGYSPYAAYAGAYSPYVTGRYLGKRSADAEPTAEADPALLYGNTFGYAGAYNAYPATYAAAAYRPYAATYAAAAYTPYAAAAYRPYTAGYNYGAYANAGRYYANSGGAVHYAKRSADAEPTAEADPALLYGNYGYVGAYNGAYAYPYNYGAYAYPYNYGAYAYPYNSAYRSSYTGYGYNAYLG